jgi:protein PET117
LILPFLSSSTKPPSCTQTMFAGVLRDDARVAAKRAQRAREAEFEEQARKRAYLETIQGVSHPVVPPPEIKGEVPTSAEGMDFGCKTCEKP